MKVFLTGATGVLGRRVIPLLVDTGHEVVAVARTPDKAAAVQAGGGHPVTVDVFDAVALADAVRAAAPDAIVNLATHIPPMARAALPGAWDENDRIRREASGYLVDAAIAAGARVFVQESITFPYADGGDAWIDEEHPMDAGDILGSCLVAEANAHRFTAEAGQGARGIVLRFAMFYGPDAAHTEEMIKAVSLGLAPVVGPAAAYQSMVHLDDAAAAVVAALGAPAGVYNVVDDTPLTRAEAASAFARGAGRRRARRAPAVALKAGGSRAAYLGRSQRVSHAKLTDATGWQPQHPSLADGLPSVVRALPGSAWDTRRWVGRRIALAVLSLNALQIGVWAAAAPGSWFRTFPGFGQVWAGADGPFNEHLTRDVGNLFLALAVVSIAALVRPGSQSVRTAAAAWLIMSVPHLAYHGLHADLLPASSAAMSLSGLALAVLVPAWLLWRPLPAGLGAPYAAEVAPTVPPVAASA